MQSNDSDIQDIALMASELVNDMDGSTEGTLEDKAQRHRQIVYAIKQLSLLRDGIEESIVGDMHEDTMHAGHMTVRREKAVRWTWKDKDSGSKMREDLAYAIANRMSTDPETAEVNVGRRRLITEAIQEVYETIPSIQTLKVAGAKRHGLSVFDYKDSTTGYRITVTGDEEDSQ